MANEINVSLQLTVNSSGFVPGQKSNQVQIDMADSQMHEEILTVPTTFDALSKGNITTEGVLWMRNLDPSNFVVYGTSTTGQFKIKAGEVAFMRINPGQTIAVKADTAAVKLWYQMLGD